MKTNLARVLCFNTVLILLFGIFFTASNTFFKKENTTKEFQFLTKSETSMVLLSFMEEEDDEETWHNLFPIFENQNIHTSFKIDSYCIQHKFNKKHLRLSNEKVPLWIKMRHIII